MNSTKQPAKRQRKKKTPDSRRSNPPSLGGWVCAWIEENLVHAEGDWYGQPFKLLTFQKAIIWRAYELEADGSRRWNQVILGLPKGNGKTELLAAIADAELAGPVMFDGWDEEGEPMAKSRLSPDIPVAAASFEQADILFSAAKTMITAGRLKPFFECYDTEILPKQGPGRLYRVAAAAGTNDGKRPTFLACDELHEWVGKKERVHLVLSNGRAKRADAWEFNISTAGWDHTSLLGRMYKAGKRNEKKKTLFIWYEPSQDWDLSRRSELKKAVKETSPAIGHFLKLETVLDRYGGMPEHEFRRYHTNQWVDNPDQWMPPEEWAAQADTRIVEAGSRIVLGFDGSYNRDSTALIGCTLDEPHLFVLGAWERPEGIADWHVPREEVLGAIETALVDYGVEVLGFDDTFGQMWGTDMEAFQEKGVTVAKWPTRSQSRMAPACGAFYGAVQDKALTHCDDPRLNRHIANCVGKGTRWGPVITKEYKDSERHIDLAVAAVIAYDMAMRNEGGEFKSVYEERGVLTF